MSHSVINDLFLTSGNVFSSTCRLVIEEFTVVFVLQCNFYVVVGLKKNCLHPFSQRSFGNLSQYFLIPGTSMTTQTRSEGVSAAHSRLQRSRLHVAVKDATAPDPTSDVSLTSLEKTCQGGEGEDFEKKSGVVMCGWMEIISPTLQGVVLPSRRRLLGNSIFQSLSRWYLGYPDLPPQSVSNGKKSVPLPFWWLTCTGSFGRAAGTLHQFVQQSPYAVVLLGGPSDGLVAHGADAAHLQPLHQTPAKKNMDHKRI